jgi:ArsR family transcriptional regulator
MKPPLDRMASLFQALGDPTRLRILGLLLTGEVCVGHIHESLRIPQPKASRHLAYLRRSGLVNTRRDGLWVYYRLIDTVDPVLGTIRHAVTDALGHLESVQKDTARLQKKTGGTLPGPVAQLPPEVASRLSRRRRGLPPIDYAERAKNHPTVAPPATSQAGSTE